MEVKLQLFGIIAVTVLITTTLIVFTSYQEYRVNTERAKNNWEAKFSNITYKQAKEIVNDKNVKEISLSYKIGESENVSIYNGGEIKFDVRAYDKNALKNANINITEGRLPKNPNEIIIGINEDENNSINQKVEIGQAIELIIGGEVKKYNVVRKSQRAEFR